MLLNDRDRRRTFVLLLLTMLLLVMPIAAHAQDEGPLGPYLVTLEPGQILEVDVYGYCLNYGLPFPGATLTPIETAGNELRVAASYSLEQAYVETNPYDVQLAVWYLSDGTRLAETDYTLADEIIAYAESGVLPPDIVDGVPFLVDSINAGYLDALVVDFINLTEPMSSASYGEGVLKITNISDQPQEIVIPYGTVFNDEGSGDQQDMLVFPKERPETPTTPPTGGLLSPIGWASVGLIMLSLPLLFGLHRWRERATA